MITWGVIAAWVAGSWVVLSVLTAWALGRIAELGQHHPVPITPPIGEVPDEALRVVDVPGGQIVTCRDRITDEQADALVERFRRRLDES